MSILIDKKTRVLIQGITGQEGLRSCQEMLNYGTKVVAGVRPGKGGAYVCGNIPVYDTVREAIGKHSNINTSLITVPAANVLDAALEGIEANIPLIVILTEHVPVKDSAQIYAAAKRKGVRVIGPSSVGILSPGKGKVGSIGSAKIDSVFKTGYMGIISKSGGMTAEISRILSNAGIGQSTVIGIGGDQIICSDFADLLELFERDAQTRATILFGEIGGTYEERVAEIVQQNKIKKPIIAIIAGEFTKFLPQGTVLGHAGAIVNKGHGSYTSKISALKKAGVLIARTLEEIPLLLNKVWNGKQK